MAIQAIRGENYGPVLVVVGIITGPLSLAFLAGAVAKAADLFALVIAKVAASERNDSIITADKVAAVKKAVGVVDLISQLPAILTSESNRVIRGSLSQSRRLFGAPQEP